MIEDDTGKMKDYIKKIIRIGIVIVVVIVAVLIASKVIQSRSADNEIIVADEQESSESEEAEESDLYSASEEETSEESIDEDVEQVQADSEEKTKTEEVSAEDSSAEDSSAYSGKASLEEVDYSVSVSGLTAETVELTTDAQTIADGLVDYCSKNEYWDMTKFVYNGNYKVNTKKNTITLCFTIKTDDNIYSDNGAEMQAVWNQDENEYSFKVDWGDY